MESGRIISAIAVIILLINVTVLSSTHQSFAFRVKGVNKIHLLLTNVNRNVGNYFIQISMKDHSITKTIYTGHQTCPDDVNAFCYTNAGIYTFKGSKKGVTIGVCNKPVSSSYNFCDFFSYNGERSQPVKSNVQEIPPEKTPYYDPNTNRLVQP